LAELVRLQLGKRGIDIEYAGIPDKHVEPAKGPHGLGDRALIVGELRDIPGDRDDRVAELRLQLGRAGHDPLHDPDPGALLDIPRNDRPADPRAAARYQRHLAVEPPHDALPIIIMSADL